MAEGRPALGWTALQRAVPVAAVVLPAGAVGQSAAVLPARSFGLFYGVGGYYLLAMVSLPVLAWVLWAPTARLAFWVGLLLVLGVAGWSWLVIWSADGPAPVDEFALYRAFPVAAAAVVVLAGILAALWHGRSRAARPGRCQRGLWMALRVVLGCVALAVAVALLFVWEPMPVATA
jgi:hypothetical protein